VHSTYQTDEACSHLHTLAATVILCGELPGQEVFVCQPAPILLLWWFAVTYTV